MKPGPRTEPFLDTVRARTVSLDDMTVEMAKVLSGEGNASRGIRAAVRYAYDLYQANRFTPGKTNGVPAAPRPPGSPQARPTDPARPDGPP